MNRSRRFDSKLSLDRASAIRDSWAMHAQPYHLYIERRDPARNMARYYALSIEPTLFGTYCLTRRWGRIGSSGRSIEHHFDGEMEAVAMFLDLLSRKRARGYSLKTIRHQRIG
ncbi:WGR domain-containing protein [Agrobacterium tumefaciens]|nr:WGR domain-containing protein [Agrobacterium tumefaciens]MQB07134.1 WGR domain-containing protein [Agrobacterium tumefaciens]